MLSPILSLALFLSPDRALVPLPLVTARAPLAAFDEASDEYQYLSTLCAKGLHPLAVKQARAFLKRFPKHALEPHARYRLATALLELKEADEAAPLLRALAAESDFEFAAEAALRLGQLELERQHDDLACAALERALALDKDYLRAPASALLAEALFRGGRFDEAETRYQQCLAACAGQTTGAAAGSKAREASTDDRSQAESTGNWAREARAGLAWCALKRGAHERVAERVADFERHHPGDELSAELAFVLGEAQAAAGHPLEAARAYERVRSGAYQESALRGAAFAALDAGDEHGAAQRFAELLQRFPQGRCAGEATVQLAALRLRAGEAQGALDLLSSQTAGEGAEVWYWRARARQSLGAGQAALLALDEAARGDPGGELAARVEDLRAELLLETGNAAEAAQAWLRSGSTDALQRGMASCMNAGHTSQAARLARELLTHQPPGPVRAEAELVLAEAQLVSKDYGAARAAFDALAHSGQASGLRARSLARAAWCSYLSGERADAAQRWAALLRDFPEAPEAIEASRMRARSLYEQAEELARAERSSEAEPYYRELLEAEPDGELAPLARYGLAWSLYQRGELDAARTELLPLGATETAGPDTRASALELLVWIESKQDRAAAAAQAWRQLAPICSDEPRRVQSARSAAGALSRAGEAPAAQALLSECLAGLRTLPACVDALSASAEIALAAQDIDAAEARARVACKLGPRESAAAEIALSVGQALLERQAHARAAELFHLAASIPGPQREQALYREGWAQLSAAHPELAVAPLGELARGTLRSEIHDQGLYLLGEAFFQQQQWEPAAARLAELRARAPASELLRKTLLRLAQSLAELAHWTELEEAASALLHALPAEDAQREDSRAESRAEAGLLRGQALAGLGRADESRAALESVLAGTRGRIAARARLELGRLELSLEHVDEALAHFLKICALYGGERERCQALLASGRCFERLGDPVHAREQYGELVERHADAPETAEAAERLRALAATSAARTGSGR